MSTSNSQDNRHNHAAYALYSIDMVDDVKCASSSEEVRAKIASSVNMTLLVHQINERLRNIGENIMTVNSSELGKQLFEHSYPRRVGGAGKTITFFLFEANNNYRLRVDCFGHFIDFNLRLNSPEHALEEELIKNNRSTIGGLLHSVEVVKDERDLATATSVRSVASSPFVLDTLAAKLNTAIKVHSGGHYELHDWLRIARQLKMGRFPGRGLGMSRFVNFYLVMKNGRYTLHVSAFGNTTYHNLSVTEVKETPVTENAEMNKHTDNKIRPIATVEKEADKTLLQSLLVPRVWNHLMVLLQSECQKEIGKDFVIDESYLTERLTETFNSYVLYSYGSCEIMLEFYRSHNHVEPLLSIWCGGGLLAGYIKVIPGDVAETQEEMQQRMIRERTQLPEPIDMPGRPIPLRQMIGLGPIPERAPHGIVYNRFDYEPPISENSGYVETNNGIRTYSLLTDTFIKEVNRLIAKVTNPSRHLDLHEATNLALYLVQQHNEQFNAMLSGRSRMSIDAYRHHADYVDARLEITVTPVKSSQGPVIKVSTVLTSKGKEGIDKCVTTAEDHIAIR